MANSYYNYADKIVYDGNLAQAADLNSVNLDVESAFDLVEADITALQGVAEYWAGIAEDWAITPEDTEVPSSPGNYSSLHWAAKSSASASAASTSESNAATSETNAAASEAAALASKNAAALSESNAAASETAAGISETNAASSAAAALVSEGNAATSEANAATSETNAAASEAAALASENKAEKWAEEAEDVEVETGKYSAYHWAQKAEDNADAAVSDTAYGPSWNGITDVAPSKNAVYDEMELKSDITTTTTKDSSTGAASLPAGTTAQRPGTPAAGMLRYNSTEDSFEGYNGTEWAGVGGGGLRPEVITSADSPKTAKAGYIYLADTSSGAITINLPVGAEGNSIGVIDMSNTFGTNAVTVTPNGVEKIMGVAESMILSTDYKSVTWMYSDATNGWRIESTTPCFSNVATFQVEEPLDLEEVNGIQTVYSRQTVGDNLIINGDFRIWQRGTSFTSSSVYTADRWYNARSSIDVYKDTDTTINRNIIRLVNNGTTDTTDIRQPVEIESNTLPVPFEPGDYTLSFRIQCSVANKNPWLFLAWRVGTGGTSAVIKSDYLTGIELPVDTWVDVEYTFDPLNDATPPASADCLLVGIGAGESGVNFTNLDEVLIADVKLERGSHATPFVPRLEAEELALCQRYYYKTIAVLYCSVVARDEAASNFLGQATVDFPVTMAETPTVTGVSASNGTHTSAQPNEQRVRLYGTPTSSASAMIYSSGMEFDAEI